MLEAASLLCVLVQSCLPLRLLHVSLFPHFLLACNQVQVGFRHAEVKNHHLLHNNQPVMLKGAPALPLGWISSALQGLQKKPPCKVPPSLVLAAGVNRHEHDERRGKTVSLESMLQVGREHWLSAELQCGIVCCLLASCAPVHLPHPLAAYAPAHQPPRRTSD